jgi:hypothetical protein
VKLLEYRNNKKRGATVNIVAINQIIDAQPNKALRQFARLAALLLLRGASVQIKNMAEFNVAAKIQQILSGGGVK